MSPAIAAAKSLAYGPTKAALINLAETLYSVHPLGIGVSIGESRFRQKHR